MSVDQRIDLTENKGWLERPEQVVIPAENGLELTELRTDDFDDIEELAALIDKNREHIEEFAERIESEQDLIRRIDRHNLFSRSLQLVVRRQSDKAIIGEAARWDNHYPEWAESMSAWISYWIDQEHINQGNGTAVVRALVKHSFKTEPALERMLAMVKADSTGPNGEEIKGNRASTATLTKAGFMFIDIVEDERDGWVSIYELRRESLYNPDDRDINLNQGV